MNNFVQYYHALFLEKAKLGRFNELRNNFEIIKILI